MNCKNEIFRDLNKTEFCFFNDIGGGDDFMSSFNLFHS